MKMSLEINSSLKAKTPEDVQKTENGNLVQDLQTKIQAQTFTKTTRGLSELNTTTLQTSGKFV
jgi:hypothetical protein